MIQFVARRFGLVLITFFGITVFTFALIHLIPGDPVMLMFGERNVDPAQMAALRAQLGLIGRWSCNTDCISGTRCTAILAPRSPRMTA